MTEVILTGPLLPGWPSLEMCEHPSSERNKFYAPISHRLVCELNRVKGTPTQVVFSRFADHIRMSGSKVREQLGRYAELEMELTTLCAF